MSYKVSLARNGLPRCAGNSVGPNLLQISVCRMSGIVSEGIMNIDIKLTTMVSISIVTLKSFSFLLTVGAGGFATSLFPTGVGRGFVMSLTSSFATKSGCSGNRGRGGGVIWRGGGGGEGVNLALVGVTVKSPTSISSGASGNEGGGEGDFERAMNVEGFEADILGSAMLSLLPQNSSSSSSSGAVP